MMLEWGQWVLHARGVLGDGEGLLASELESFAESAWPPPGAEEIDTEFFYDRLAEAGYDYGPVFQGLRGAWREGDAVFAEVALGEEQAAQARVSLCIRRCWMLRCIRWPSRR